MDTLDEAELKRQKLLKIIVVSLGIMILAILAGIVWAILFKPQKTAVEMQRPSIAQASDMDALGKVKLSLPPGASVETVDLNGHYYVVRLVMPEGGWRVLVVDARSGALKGSLDMTRP